nr:hypothetical protein [Candidatus Baldrarchaeota archaeon]
MLLLNRKAQYYAVDFIVASLIILGILSLVYTHYYISYDQDRAVYLSNLGYRCLNVLAESGELSKTVYNEDWETLSQLIDLTLPSNVYFSYYVYRWGSESWIRIVGPVGEDMPDNSLIVKVTYVLSGNYTDTSPRKIELYLWE